jgi:hypothetical protein
MLFVGLQFVIWSISGAYMVIFDIDYIHGDTLVANHQGSLKGEQVNYSIAQLYQDYPQAKEVELTSLLGEAVYRFSADKGNTKNKYLLSADSGNPLSPLNKAYAVQIATNLSANAQAGIEQVSLITEKPPFELSARHLPVWRIDFDDFASSSFYISVQTGELVSKRHTFWRLFDWMFSFHVMDYVEEDASNKLLLVVCVFALVASFFGLVLSYFRVFKQGSNKGLSKNQRRGELH